MNTKWSAGLSGRLGRTAFPLLQGVLHDQSGQVLPIVAAAMSVLMGILGLTVDVGRSYVVRAELQNSANAAALAAAGSVYTSQSATVNTTSVADQYSSSNGDKNADSRVSGVTTTVTTKCLNSLMPVGFTCQPGTSSNAVHVVQTAQVNTTFMRLFGIPSLTVSAQATASMQGTSLPWNVAVIVDSTGSMASTDSNCGGVTQFQCALTGVQSLLATTPPCPAGVASCTNASANVRMSLFTFPNVLTEYNGVSTNSISDDTNCAGVPATWTSYTAQPIAAPYTLPVPGAALPGAPDATYLTYKQTGTGKKWKASYQITPFVSDYYSAGTSTKLNGSSVLVKAVGNGNTQGCLTYTFGIWGTGSGSGFGNTYVAGALYAAQSALASEQALYGGRNAIIVLSDGGMNASYYSENPLAYGLVTPFNQFSQAYEFPSGPVGSEVGPAMVGYPTPAYYTPATSTKATEAYDTLGINGIGIYPDWNDQCQQAIQAGQYATNHSTTVFSVAYGAGTTGCSSGWNVGMTDTSLVATGTNQPFVLSTLNPCVELENVASSLSTFYSDYTQGGTATACVDNSHTAVSLSDIFQAIGTTFTTPRLLPNDAT